MGLATVDIKYLGQKAKATNALDPTKAQGLAWRLPKNQDKTKVCLWRNKAQVAQESEAGPHVFSEKSSKNSWRNGLRAQNEEKNVNDLTQSKRAQNKESDVNA